MGSFNDWFFWWGEAAISYDISNVNFLVLEKHTLVRKIMTEVFREFGVSTVQSTANPEIAWQMFNTSSIDIILSDWTHGLDGMHFLRRVRKDRKTPNPFVPVIIITANTELDHIIEARDNGMTEFLAKPVSANLIYSRIVRVIENNRSFVRLSDFFGPDRRRRVHTGFTHDERRKTA
jgi:two-component system, chemotaxis family, chemotaxis protein CheY